MYYRFISVYFYLSILLTSYLAFTYTIKANQTKTGSSPKSPCSKMGQNNEERYNRFFAEGGRGTTFNYRAAEEDKATKNFNGFYLHIQDVPSFEGRVVQLDPYQHPYMVPFVNPFTVEVMGMLMAEGIPVVHTQRSITDKFVGPYKFTTLLTAANMDVADKMSGQLKSNGNPIAMMTSFTTGLELLSVFYRMKEMQANFNGWVDSQLQTINAKHKSIEVVDQFLLFYRSTMIAFEEVKRFVQRGDLDPQYTLFLNPQRQLEARILNPQEYLDWMVRRLNYAFEVSATPLSTMLDTLKNSPKMRYLPLSSANNHLNSQAAEEVVLPPNSVTLQIVDGVQTIGENTSPQMVIDRYQTMQGFLLNNAGTTSQPSFELNQLMPNHFSVESGESFLHQVNPVQMH